MRAYTQQVLSAPARIPVMIKKGKKMVQLTKTTKSGQVKKVYQNNPASHQIKAIRHRAVQNYDVAAR